MKNYEILKLFRQQDRYLKFNEFLDSLPKDDTGCIQESENSTKPTLKKDSIKTSTSETRDSSSTESTEMKQSLMNGTSNQNTEENESLGSLQMSLLDTLKTITDQKS